jgi:hypothetical protein
MFKEYKSGMMSIFPLYERDSFKRYKESKLPPSLYNSLNDFYKFSLIEIVKQYMEDAHDRCNQIQTEFLNDMWSFYIQYT